MQESWLPLGNSNSGTQENRRKRDKDETSTSECNGGLPEWLKGADCKSAGYAYTGSNPVAPTEKFDELKSEV